MNGPSHWLLPLVEFSSPFPTPLPLFPRETPTHPPGPHLSQSLLCASCPASLVMAHSALPFPSLLCASPGLTHLPYHTSPLPLLELTSFKKQVHFFL